MCGAQSSVLKFHATEASLGLAGVLGGASQPTDVDIASKNVKNRLLVLYHKSLVVAIPIQLAAHTYISAIQAKNAVIHHVSQLFAFTDLDWLQTSV